MEHERRALPASWAKLVDEMEAIQQQHARERGPDGAPGGWKRVFMEKYPCVPIEPIRQLVMVKKKLGPGYFGICARIGRHKSVLVASISNRSLRNKLLTRGLEGPDGAYHPLERRPRRELEALVAEQRDRGRPFRGPAIRWPRHLDIVLRPVERIFPRLKDSFRTARGSTEVARSSMRQLKRWRGMAGELWSMLNETIVKLGGASDRTPKRRA